MMETILSYLENGAVRAVCMVVVGLLVLNLPSVLLKAKLSLMGCLYMVFCHDKSYKLRNTDPGVIFVPLLKEADKGEGKIEKKTVIFIRHGESTWNDTFNKGSHRSLGVFIAGYIPGLVKAVLYELYLLLAGKVDSWFYDAPMSTLGLTQTEALAAFLDSASKPNSTATDREKQLVAILNNDPGAPPSKTLSSPLRRAISTVAIGLRRRLERSPEDKIVIHPSLQEIARNPDTLAITPPHTPVTASWIEQDYKPIPDLQHLLHTHVDVSNHTGNKPLSTNGLKRMTAFNDYVFDSLDEQYVIVGGHSIWFRSFFRAFLPYNLDHASKTKKVVNCGAVAFTLMKTNHPKEGVVYMIDPNTIEVIYGGFQK
eukprot:CAMPEP_0185728680 /NCGR_PEP_ID=MMETSP1171-20130828/4040_1 /TAXON_ID=374046 /ORGANISM="Helicotheca tamensis, Strain CCMP826" /LENGTH=368 /DNA_ID=CAMNT_0028397411 /DNA_START=58 /DNA_END=1164 /DNA_ORIENTATION=+